jgi:hypothetical protein
MMKDKLHRFVRDNREAFDTESPSDELWEKINAQLPQTLPSEQHPVPSAGNAVQEDVRKKHFPRFLTTFTIGNWRVAAAVVLAVGLGWYANDFNQKYNLIEQPTLALSSPTHAKQVSQYTQLIETKQAELRQITYSNPALYREFSAELNRLESSYQNLKSELSQNPNQEMVIQAMIQNLEWQIELLNQQLDIMQRIKSKQNHEKGSII